MSTVNLVPNAAGDSNECGGQDGPNDANNYLHIDDPVGSPDDDTTYLIRTSTYALDLYNVPNQSLSGDISNVTVYARTKYLMDMGACFKIAVKIGGTVYYSAEKYPGGSWTNDSNVWTTNPNTSAAWTWANINDLQIGIAMQDFCCVTQVYAVVTYSDAIAIPVFMNQYRQRRA